MFAFLKRLFAREPFDPWDCKCHERKWQRMPHFINHIDGPAWFTSCTVCYEMTRVGDTRAEAQRAIDAFYGTQR